MAIIYNGQEISSGGQGTLTLGPETNEFSGTTLANAESARDTFATANSAWLTEYNENPGILIELSYTSPSATAVYQRRNAAGTAWETVTGLLQGPPGLSGVTATNAAIDERIGLRFLTPDANGNLPTPTAENQLGLLRGNIYISHVEYYAGTAPQGTWAEYTRTGMSAGGNQLFYGIHNSDPSTIPPVEHIFYYNPARNRFRVVHVEQFGFSLTFHYSWRDTHSTVLFSGDLSFLGQFDTVEEAALAIRNFDMDIEYYAYVRTGTYANKILHLDNTTYVAGSDESTIYSWSEADAEALVRIHALEQQAGSHWEIGLPDTNIAAGVDQRTQFNDSAIIRFLNANSRARAVLRVGLKINSSAADAGTVTVRLQHGTTSISSQTISGISSGEETVSLTTEVDDLSNGLYLFLRADPIDASISLDAEDIELEIVAEFIPEAGDVPVDATGFAGNLDPQTVQNLQDVATALDQLTTGGNGGLSETATRGLISDWAEQGDASDIPSSKLSNAPRGFRGAFSDTTTYMQGDQVIDGGIFYISRIDNNIGNTPATSSIQWYIDHPPTVISQSAAEAGISIIPRLFTAERVNQAISALGGDTVAAGTGITITTNADDEEEIAVTTPFTNTDSSKLSTIEESADVTDRANVYDQVKDIIVAGDNITAIDSDSNETVTIRGEAGGNGAVITAVPQRAESVAFQATSSIVYPASSGAINSLATNPIVVEYGSGSAEMLSVTPGESAITVASRGVYVVVWTGTNDSQEDRSTPALDIYNNDDTIGTHTPIGTIAGHYQRDTADDYRLYGTGVLVIASDDTVIKVAASNFVQGYTSDVPAFSVDSGHRLILYRQSGNAEALTEAQATDEDSTVVGTVSGELLAAAVAEHESDGYHLTVDRNYVTGTPNVSNDVTLVQHQGDIYNLGVSRHTGAEALPERYLNALPVNTEIRLVSGDTIWKGLLISIHDDTETSATLRIEFDDRTGTFSVGDTIAISFGYAPAQNPEASDVVVEASGFDGNLADTDDTVQKVAQKVDDLQLTQTTETENAGQDAWSSVFRLGYVSASTFDTSTGDRWTTQPAISGFLIRIIPEDADALLVGSLISGTLIQVRTTNGDVENTFTVSATPADPIGGEYQIPGAWAEAHTLQSNTSYDLYFTQARPGASGDEGTSATFLIYLYQNASSAPSVPTGGTYTFATDVISNVPSGWAVTSTTPTGNNRTYRVKATIDPNTDDATVAPVWEGLLPISGRDGDEVAAGTGITITTNADDEEEIAVANPFTDTDEEKLDDIESEADVTDRANVYAQVKDIIVGGSNITATDSDADETVTLAGQAAGGATVTALTEAQATDEDSTVTGTVSGELLAAAVAEHESDGYHLTVDRNYVTGTPNQSNDVTLVLHQGDVYNMGIARHTGAEALPERYLNALPVNTEIRLVSGDTIWKGLLISIHDDSETSATLRIEFDDRTGTFSVGDTIAISFGYAPAQNPSASNVVVEASGFDGNLATTDTNLQLVAQKVDDLNITRAKAAVWWGFDQTSRFGPRRMIDYDFSFRHTLRFSGTDPNETFFGGDTIGAVMSDTVPAFAETNIDMTESFNLESFQVFQLPAGVWHVHCYLVSEATTEGSIELFFRQVQTGVDDSIIVHKPGWTGEGDAGYATFDLDYPYLETDGTELFYFQYDGIAGGADKRTVAYNLILERL